MENREVFREFRSEYIDGHNESFSCFAHNPKIPMFATAATDGTTKFWEYKNE
jgi:hypothetical protein